jgi:DNA-binding MarR family transcriptional regulator
VNDLCPYDVPYKILVYLDRRGGVGKRPRLNAAMRRQFPRDPYVVKPSLALLEGRGLVEVRPGLVVLTEKGRKLVEKRC